MNEHLIQTLIPFMLGLICISPIVGVILGGIFGFYHFRNRLDHHKGVILELILLYQHKQCFGEDDSYNRIYPNAIARAKDAVGWE